jgi:secreted PhoX family phosphatase
VRWREQGGDAAATRFAWDVKGNAFGSPDGIWFDSCRVLWIQTDVSTSALNKGNHANLGNNQMLAADPATGDIRRFLTGPKGCEVTGVMMTPDLCTMVVNIQHPGEPANERSDLGTPTGVSTWPDGAQGGQPRSATIVIRKRDGGIIGS